jgi:enamine deaminase RidA (YjgF/YER057c/UK114 family)
MTYEEFMGLKLENPVAVSPPQGRYMHVVEVPAGRGLVFVSGQVPVALDGTIPESLADQADLVYANLVAVLAAKSVPPTNIIKLQTFFTEDDPKGVVRQARAKYLGEHRPASTAVGVRRLVDERWKIEIDAVALAAE